jgi:hypothetical protein
MTETYHKPMKRHDTGEPVRLRVISETDGQPVPLTGVNASFHMYKVENDGSTTELVNAAASIEYPSTAGIVRYDWQVGDTTEIGLHLAEFELVFPTGEKEHYPREGYIEIAIELDLDDA